MATTTLQSSITPRERVLIMGGEGTGKTSNVLHIARRVPNASFYCLDTDSAMERMLTGANAPLDAGNGGNVHSTLVTEWQEYLDTLATYQSKMTRDDWLVIDMLPPAWDAVQDYFSEKVFGKGVEQYFFEARAAQKKGNAFDGRKDWCVDVDTEILTARGWKRYDEIVVGQDEALALDPATMASQWEVVRDLYVGDAISREMVAMEGNSHSSLTTPDHRWLVEQQIRMDGELAYRTEWRTSNTLTSQSRIPHAAPYMGAPDMPKHADAIVELVAWYWTEGWRTQRTDRPSPQGGIGQSLKRNPGKVAAIRLCLIKMFGREGWAENLRTDGVVIFRLNKIVMETLDALAPGKMPSYDFILSLTQAQLALFVQKCIDGDGSDMASGQRTFYQVDSEGTNRFEMAAVLAGYAVRSKPRSASDTNRFGRLPTNTSILRSGGAWPVMAARLDGKASSTTVTHDGIVWCPVTTSGTWLARRNGTVYFTGNTVINKLYKAWAQSLVLKTPGHVYATSAITAVQDDDDKQVKNLFGRYGVKPQGQKHTGHIFHTVLLASKGRVGEWRITTVKDRERQEVENLVVGDPGDGGGFAKTYLQGIAGWKIGVVR